MSTGLGWRRRTTGTTRTRRRYEGGRWRGNGRRTDSRRRYGNGSGYRDGPGRRRTLGSGGLDTFARGQVVGFVPVGVVGVCSSLLAGPLCGEVVDPATVVVGAGWGTPASAAR